MLEIINLIRVRQWVKNGFILVPAFFSGSLVQSTVLLDVFAGFVSFSFAASSIYILNDYKDRDKDKLHPEKRMRPLASGSVKLSTALFLFVILLTSSIALAAVVSQGFLLIVSIYFIMNVAYSLKLKEMALLDVIIISIGFLLRVVAGGVLADVLVSKWLFLMTFLLAMILAFAKRRDDLTLFKGEEIVRKSIKGYNLTFIDHSISFLATVTFVAYIMYSVSDEVINQFHNNYIYASSLFVLIGLLRYFQLAFVYNKTGSPTKLLYTDRVIQLSILCWISFFAVVIYL